MQRRPTGEIDADGSSVIDHGEDGDVSDAEFLADEEISGKAEGIEEVGVEDAVEALDFGDEVQDCGEVFHWGEAEKTGLIELEGLLLYFFSRGGTLLIDRSEARRSQLKGKDSRHSTIRPRS